MIDEAVLAEAQRAAERLHDALRNVFLRFGKERTASALSRFSGVERTVCQRLVSALMNGALSPETLTRVPGPKAINAIAEGLLTAGLAEADGLQAASLQLENLFRRVGRSQRGFTRALLDLRTQDSAVPEDEPVLSDVRFAHDADVRQRAQFFQMSKKLVGNWSRAQVQIAIFAPSLTDPNRLDSARVRGVIGYHAQPGTPSLIFQHTRFSSLAIAEAPGTFGLTDPVQPPRPPTPNPMPLAAHETAPQRLPEGPALLERFCSDPPPGVVTKAFGAHQQCFVVDSSSSEKDQSFDLILADQTLSSLATGIKRNYRCDEIWAMVNYPTECLLLDVYLHESVARMCLPGIDMHLWTPGVGDPMRNDRWATRLPQVPDLKVLGQGLRKTASAFYPRHAELVADVFARFGRDPHEFVGYRCEEPFPAWRVGYRMFFDYGSTQETP